MPAPILGRGRGTTIFDAYYFRGRIGFPGQDPGELVPQREELRAGVHDGVGLVVGLEDPVVAEAVRPRIGAAVDGAGRKVHAELSGRRSEPGTAADFTKRTYLY